MPFDGQAQWQIDILAADKTAQAFASVESRLKGLAAVQADLGKVLSGQASAGQVLVSSLGRVAAAYATIATAKKLIDIGLEQGELVNQASQLQVTTDLLQALRLQAATSGVSVERLDQAIIHLAQSAGTANDGSAEMIARFDRLGVKLLDARGQLRPVQDLLPEVANGLRNVASSTERTSLMADLFGKSGARMATLLDAIAQGNDRLIASGRAKNGITDEDALRKWDELGNHLAESNIRFKALVGQMGAPVMAPALDVMNVGVALLAKNLASAKEAFAAIAGYFNQTTQDQLNAAQADLQAFLDRGMTSSDGVVKELQAKIATLRGHLNPSNSAPFTLPAVTVTAGALQPAAKGGSGGRDRIGEELERLRGELKATQDSYLQMQDLARSALPIDELQRQVDLTKRIGDELAKIGKYDKNDPRLPQVRSLITELAIADTRSKQFTDALKAADTAERAFGDGTLGLAQQQRDLAAAFATGRLSQEAYTLAQQEGARTAEDLRLKNIGLAGGLPALAAGWQSAANQYARQNDLFATGGQLFQGTMNLMDQAINDLVTNGTINFGKLAQSFAAMILQMELRAAASELWKGVGGFSGLLGLLGGGGGPTTGPGLGYTYARGGVFAPGGLVPFARGGIVGGPTVFPFANGVGLMGEAGPEAIMPLSRGPGGRLGVSMHGGGITVEMPVTIINNAPANVSTRQTTGPGGVPSMTVLIEPLEAAMASRAARGQGALAKFMQGKYGDGAPQG